MKYFLLCMAWTACCAVVGVGAFRELQAITLNPLIPTQPYMVILENVTPEWTAHCKQNDNCMDIMSLSDFAALENP